MPKKTLSSTPEIFEPSPLPLQQEEFRFYLGNSTPSAIGGSGSVFGTISWDEIGIVDRPGTLVFDATFNRGNDLISLSGAAETWLISRVGSQVLLSDGDTNLNIPVGKVGIFVNFAGEIHKLRYDEAADAVKIGEQVVEETPAAVLDEATVPFQGTDAYGNGARAYLSAGGTFLAGNGDVAVFGTDASEHVIVDGGNVYLDGTFNRGGDVVTFRHNADDYNAIIKGGSQVIVYGKFYAGAATIPVGAAGIELEFADGSQILRADLEARQVWLGDRLVPVDITPVPSFG